MADEKVNESAVDLSSLGALDFAPSWTTGEKVVAKNGRGGFRDDSGDRSEQGEAQSRRPPRRDNGPKGDRDRPRRRDDADGRRRAEQGGGDRQRGSRPRDGRDGNNSRRGFVKREFIKPLDAEVRVLPGQKDLGGIIRKIQTGYIAYPLKQIAFFFLDHPEACNVKVTPKDPQVKFHVCKACGYSCATAEALDAHLLSAHLGDYYTAEETEVEPPAGQFGCVVKCGITGELIGPPNLHGYNAAVREMAQKLGMDESAYRARLVTVRDQDAVEAWRKGATKKTFYRLKVDGKATPAEGDGAEESEAKQPVPALEREQAEAAFRRDIMPQLRGISKSSDMSLDQALKSNDLPYLFAVRDAVARERRFPASLFFALRGAFHHRKLVFFRANEPRGQEFVCAVKPTPLDTAHAIPELVAVVNYVSEHPLCNVNDLPKEMKGHLGWLVEKGHIVQYFNGLLALPEDNPKFRNLPAKKEVVASAAPVASAAVSEVGTSADAEGGKTDKENKEEVVDEAADKLA